MQNILRFPAISRLPLVYPNHGHLWTQTLIGRAPKISATNNRYFEEVAWILPNVPADISRNALVIFTTNKGLVSIRNTSRNNIIKITFEAYLPFIKLGPNEETFVTNRELFRNLTIQIDGAVKFRVASYGSNSLEGTRISELERTM